MALVTGGKQCIYLTNCSSYLYQIKFSTLPFHSGTETDQEAKHTCKETDELPIHSSLQEDCTKVRTGRD